ncbi:cell envelope biogenesis protein TolA [Candidatus Pelagibacter sp. Uisw_094]|uniref:cell envelope biogenesis protein TolA n=1 Tax=Candidatus Pelagibacter sp. Uisw_094 TaxID=3230980 RepID=UPI0023326509|nr:cell envelope biogenesis protein TolA [Candidatus Pelagibacter sp.]MDC0516127.1 cell envelope biogenesis protein TolA [Candidatus Pelagibacter sp.]
MNRNIFISFGLHIFLVIITAMSLPFLAKKPIDLPPIISVELIQISDKTNIPFAPKAKKIIEKVKEKEKKLISEQAPPKKIKKTKTKTVVSLDKKLEKIDNQKPESLPLPEKTVKKIETKKETKQNPEKVVTEVKQVSEFEKKDIFDPSDIAALIDKSKTESAETNKKLDKITQDQDKEMDFGGLTLSEEDALKAQIFGCWSIPLGLPFNEDLLVRIKLQLEPDGSIIKTEILDHARMNRPGQGFYKVLAESALRAIKLCQPLRVPSTGYERWKDMQLNFDAREMLEG